MYALEAFAVGAFLGDSFLHQLPHAFGESFHAECHDQSCGHSWEHSRVGLSVLFGVLAFLFLDVQIRRHAKRGAKTGLAVLNVVADGFHNLMVRMVILSPLSLGMVECSKLPARVDVHMDICIYCGLAGQDGLAIGVAFLLRGRSQGFKLAMLVAVHEIPQEIGDAGLLLSSGMVIRIYVLSVTIC